MDPRYYGYDGWKQRSAGLTGGYAPSSRFRAISIVVSRLDIRVCVVHGGAIWQSERFDFAAEFVFQFVSNAEPRHHCIAWVVVLPRILRLQLLSGFVPLTDLLGHAICLSGPNVLS